MTVDTRNTKEPVPDNWANMLSDTQIITINQYSNFGWKLWFIRRGWNIEPIPVMKNQATQEVVVVDRDGEFSQDHELVFRD